MGLTTEGLSVTAKDTETSAIASGGQGGADDELWLTYLNYDQRIQQAVRRLGALSSENVDVFRSLLLKGRDRSRLKDYEAESVRRLQGEAFVDDEELQRTLIVLNAEDPRYGEELKRLVRAGGKPDQLDQAVAAIRAGKSVQIKPVAVPDPAPVQAAPPPKEPVVAPPERPAEAVVVPLRKEVPASIAPKPVAVTREGMREETGPRRSLTPVVLAGAGVLVAAIAALWLAPGLISGSKTVTVQKPSAPAKPQAVATAKPAAINLPAPVQAQKSAAASPTLRPATTQPEAAAAHSEAPADNTKADTAAAPQPGTVAPTAGAKYKVVRGDMLSQIALQVYGDASKFRMIQAANPSLRNKPDRILVDQVIFLPPDKR